MPQIESAASTVHRTNVVGLQNGDSILRLPLTLLEYNVMQTFYCFGIKKSWAKMSYTKIVIQNVVATAASCPKNKAFAKYVRKELQLYLNKSFEAFKVRMRVFDVLLAHYQK